MVELLVLAPSLTRLALQEAGYTAAETTPEAVPARRRQRLRTIAAHALARFARAAASLANRIAPGEGSADPAMTPTR